MNPVLWLKRYGLDIKEWISLPMNCSQGPPAEKTGRGSLLNSLSCTPDYPILHGTELNWTDIWLRTMFPSASSTHPQPLMRFWCEWKFQLLWPFQWIKLHNPKCIRVLNKQTQEVQNRTKKEKQGALVFQNESLGLQNRRVYFVLFTCLCCLV